MFSNPVWHLCCSRICPGQWYLGSLTICTPYVCSHWLHLCVTGEEEHCQWTQGQRNSKMRIPPPDLEPASPMFSTFLLASLSAVASPVNHHSSGADLKPVSITTCLAQVKQGSPKSCCPRVVLEAETACCSADKTAQCCCIRRGLK